MTMHQTRQDEPAVEEIARRLQASENVRDMRAGNDLQELLGCARGQWRGRFQILRAGRSPEGGLGLVCAIRAAGLVWSSGRAERRESFTFIVGIPGSYPLSMPVVQFLEPVPWCGHVVHRDFMPDAATLPAALQAYLREGHGRCCYLRSDQWTVDHGSLAIVVWQVSRILTLAKGWGEQSSLNSAARDHALRLGRQEGRLPLGPPLPCPGETGDDAAAAASIAVSSAPDAAGDGDGDDDVDWTVANQETHDAP